MQKVLNLCFVMFIGIILAGCASIIQGGTQKVPINSRPSEASVKVFDRSGQIIGSGSTPCTLTLNRGAGFFSSAQYRVVIEKDGYTTREVMLKGSVNGWYIGGNILFGGPIGWLIVDPATGAMWSLSPSEVHAELQSQQSMIFNEKDGLTVVMLAQVPSNYRQLMKPIGANL